jgi:hypothetical protein
MLIGGSTGYKLTVLLPLSKELILKVESSQVIKFGVDMTGLSAAKDESSRSNLIKKANEDRSRFNMARQLVADSSLAQLHKLGRQGLSEILRSFFSLMKIRQPNDFDRHFTEAMSGGVVNIIESAFKPTGSRTISCQFDKFFKDKGKGLPRAQATKHEGEDPVTKTAFKDGIIPSWPRGPKEALPVELVCSWSGGPVLHKCVLRSATYELEYEGVHLLPSLSSDGDGEDLPVIWHVRRTEQIPVWTEDLMLNVTRNDPVPIFSTRYNDGSKLGKK